jgi:hypothetical protein
MSQFQGKIDDKCGLQGKLESVSMDVNIERIHSSTMTTPLESRVDCTF